jgi:hypothetical protein
VLYSLAGAGIHACSVQRRGQMQQVLAQLHAQRQPCRVIYCAAAAVCALGWRRQRG